MSRTEGWGRRGGGQSEGKRRERSGRRKSENLDRSVAQETHVTMLP